MSNRDKNTPQRALVLQGGGSLGVLYYWIKKDIHGDNENVFDIVAGTSIGAINTAILVSHAKENGKWEGSPKKLIDFWEYLSSSLTSSFKDWSIQLLTNGSSVWRTMFPYLSLASKETFRRYYSTDISLLSPYGEPRVFTPLIPLANVKFLDFSNPSAWWFRYSNEPLRSSISKFIKEFPIATSDEENNSKMSEPRLLLVSVDVQEGATVTFDSYKYRDTKCKICESEEQNNTDELINHINNYHLREQKYKKGTDIRWSVYGSKENRYAIFYDGIELDHVIASSSVPLHYGYTEIEAVKSKAEKNSKVEKETRYFWDGGLLSNTPLRELISEHFLFWKNKLNINAEDLSTRNWSENQSNWKAPDLDVYVVSVWPSKENMHSIPLYDYDLTKDRKNDITHHDKTEYDEKTAKLATDYIHFIDEMGNLVLKANEKIKDPNDSKEITKEFNNILKMPAKSTQRTGDKRKYRDLVAGRFALNQVVRIEREDDPHTISNKWFDFSYSTISQLIQQGINDALKTLVDNIKKSEDNQAADNQLNKFINEVKREEQNGELPANRAIQLRKLAETFKSSLDHT
jgi:predicted acylesterase/phospholipase RssA